MTDTHKKPHLRIAIAVAFLALVAGAIALAFRDPAVDAPSRDPALSSGKTARVADAAGKRLLLLTPTPHARAAEAVVKMFEKESGAVFQVKVVNYEEVGDVIEKDHASSAPQIDVFITYYSHLASLATHGIATDLTEFIAQNKDVIHPEDFIPGVYDYYTLYQGRRWSLPFDADTHVLFYRKSLLAKYHLAPPETWDDYVNVSRTITEHEKAKGIYGAAIMAHPVPVLIVSSFMNRLGAFGGDLMDENGRPAVNSPEAVAALEAMLEHARYALPTPLDTDFDVARAAFLSGRVAMVEQWTDIGVMAEDPSQSTIQGDWGAVPIPKGPGPRGRHASALNAGFILGVTRTTKEPEIAKAFIRFATRSDTLLALNLLNGGLDPARLSVLNAPQFKTFAPQMSALEQVTLTQPTVALPRVPETRELMDALTQKLAQAMDHHMTARQALDAAQSEWVRILDHTQGDPGADAHP